MKISRVSIIAGNRNLIKGRLQCIKLNMKQMIYKMEEYLTDAERNDILSAYTEVRKCISGFHNHGIAKKISEKEDKCNTKGK